MFRLCEIGGSDPPGREGRSSLDDPASAMYQPIDKPVKASKSTRQFCDDRDGHAFWLSTCPLIQG